jgi:hypothetical protein
MQMAIRLPRAQQPIYGPERFVACGFEDGLLMSSASPTGSARIASRAAHKGTASARAFLATCDASAS